jgi:hypothetical protein
VFFGGRRVAENTGSCAAAAPPLLPDEATSGRMDGWPEKREKKGMDRSLKATDEIALVAMSQKVSKRYLNLKGKRKKITYIG